MDHRHRRPLTQAWSQQVDLFTMPRDSNSQKPNNRKKRRGAHFLPMVLTKASAFHMFGVASFGRMSNPFPIPDYLKETSYAFARPVTIIWLALHFQARLITAPAHISRRLYVKPLPGISFGYIVHRLFALACKCNLTKWYHTPCWRLHTRAPGSPLSYCSLPGVAKCGFIPFVSRLSRRCDPKRFIGSGTHSHKHGHNKTNCVWNAPQWYYMQQT